MAEQPKTSALKTVLRFCRIVLYGTLGIFGAFCILDFADVHFHSPAIVDTVFWYVFGSLPLLICLGSALSLRSLSAWVNFPLSVCAALLSSVFGFVMILVLGLWFHAVIGGTL